MYQSARSLQRSCSARQSEALKIVATYHFLAPAIFAARERLATNLAHHHLAPESEPRVAMRSRPIRGWLGARLIRLGAWLGGTGVPAGEATMGG